ncbi:acetyltransferase [Colletotrichum truncatum]|uniref:Acetyltransferase n=1 Tax=Colletotrichum truncatum TaxID=5467 RepID=A0ACC3Z7B6_COLTU|nr:acetyltransferase [Colletotrichum truncatum]KAF6785318.1 acetyltransferase [Colletotrichum truncatum]
MDITIRPVEPADIPAIVDFVKEGRLVMFPMLDIESQNQYAQQELAKFQQRFIDSSHGWFLAAYSNDQLIATVGYLAYDDRFPKLGLGCEGVVEVVRLFVNPAWRRAKLASRLMTMLEERARQTGIKTLYLHTHPFLDGAIKFWERQGFAIVGYEDDPFWQTTHMSKRIAE